MGQRTRNRANNVNADGTPSSIPAIDTSQITTGTMADARISESSVTQHSPATDLQPLKSDLSALALREATNEASIGFNLPNQFIDTFATDTLGTKTDVIVSDGQVSSASTTTAQATVSMGGNVYHKTGEYKWGSSSIKTGNSASDYLHWDLGATAGDFGTGDWTIEMWRMYTASVVWYDVWRVVARSDLDGADGYVDEHTGGSANDFYYRAEGPNITNHTSFAGNSTSLSTSTWNHFAMVRNGNDHLYYRDGSLLATNDIGSGAIWNMRYGTMGKNQHTLYWDDFRISNIARYTGSSYTVPSARLTTDSNTRFLLQSINQANNSQTFADTGYSSTIVNATGTAIQSGNVVGSAKTKVGGTMLYKDNAGTATIGTDLKIYFTCNGGTNWTEAASYNVITPVYSTGIKQLRLGETTCTSGTDIRYKAVWANQAAGTKETQLHGIGINY